MTNDTSQPVSRRRAITILAVGAGAAFVPASLPAASLSQFEWTGAEWTGFEWTGTALGAPARIMLQHRQRAVAADAVAACVAEVARLEREFSLYRPDSALSRLNRDGYLEAPSHDMRRLLSECRRFGDLSGGAFDVTIQPLWRLYARHFAPGIAGAPDAVAGPSAAELAAALALVDYRRIATTPDRIALRPGMGLTLNGIAQGYITDRAADLLRARGWRHVLIDLGEIRALDDRPDGRPWSIALAGAGRVPIADQAIATSAGSGTPFTQDGRAHHLFNPKTGRSANTYRSVTVIAARATVADALSSAIYVAPRAEAGRLLRAGGGIEARLLDMSGRVQRVRA